MRPMEHAISLSVNTDLGMKEFAFLFLSTPKGSYLSPQNSHHFRGTQKALLTAKKVRWLLFFPKSGYLESWLRQTPGSEQRSPPKSRFLDKLHSLSVAFQSLHTWGPSLSNILSHFSPTYSKCLFITNLLPRMSFPSFPFAKFYIVFKVSRMLEDTIFQQKQFLSELHFLTFHYFQYNFLVKHSCYIICYNTWVKLFYI